MIDSSDSDRAASQPASRETMTLAELTGAADVSVRTVRYYIAEGLLPPPEGAGPASVYTQGHLDRLRLIQRLKEAYLPLKEIRRRLAGLDDAEVRAMLSGAAGGVAAASTHASAGDASLAGARDYLAMMESRPRYRTAPMALPLSPPPSEEPALRPPARLARRELSAAADPMEGARPAAASEPALEAAREHELWRRIALGDEAELVISEHAYQRHRDRVDWLVRWARKVFA